MFIKTDKPRVFGQAPGTDFPMALITGLIERFETDDPTDLARVEVFVNTRRMQRRVRAAFDDGAARLLPRIRLITDLSNEPAAADLPLPVPPLRRRFELTQLVSGLLEQQPDLAPRAALFDLADSLANLMDEMHGEGVDPSMISRLDVSDQSGHWERALQFMTIAQTYFDDAATQPDVEARQRLIIDRMTAEWESAPPEHPIIIAGSTGSRGATSKLMAAVAKLPQGAIILPGFDFHMESEIWSHLMPRDPDATHAEDHPQFRFAKLLFDLGVSSSDVQPWSSEKESNKARNKFFSLALCPAPVTDHWLRDGPKLSDIEKSTENITIVEASSPREEALAIAFRLRQAIENKETAALISPDRTLTRQVTAALSKWNVIPDDSAGTPLQLTAGGRFMRHLSSLIGQEISAEALLTLMKHPLFCAGSNIRGQHLLWTRELEIELRRNGPPVPTANDLIVWADKSDNKDQSYWAQWVAKNVYSLTALTNASLTDFVGKHIALAERLSAGPSSEEPEVLWKNEDGRALYQSLSELRNNAQYGGSMGVHDYVNLFSSVLAQGEVRSATEPHPNILIWGTLEARVQGADLVILSGLNEGTWPETPSPDPWLNRAMRKQAGLLLPERRIGLSAHDFQQAVGVEKLWITRSIRNDEAETVPSRWVNRMTNLLGGLPNQNGLEALENMRERGSVWLKYARANDVPKYDTPPASRPSPRPPLSSRPKSLSVTQIKTLVRDPYAIYAREILRLKKLDPLSISADARQRGIALHRVMEEFIRGVSNGHLELTTSDLIRTGTNVFSEEIPWPMTQRLWLARLSAMGDLFLNEEKERQSSATPLFFEKRGKLTIDEIDFTLTGVLDRIDITSAQTAHVFDYKSGDPPTPKQQKYFDKQLYLQAMMVERGAFEDVPICDVERAAYLGLKRIPKTVVADLDDQAIATIWEEFIALIEAFRSYDRGYSSQIAMLKDADPGEYGHLARYGEWDISAAAEPEDLT